MTTSVLELLRCPVCGAAGREEQEGRVFACLGERRHCFDFARSGYLNLCPAAKAGGGDSREAVRARSAFLEAGYYRPLSDAVNTLLHEVGAASVLDAGCGEGYYTNRMAPGRTAIGADLSRPGVDHAAKAAKQGGSGAAFVIAGLFALPVRDAGLDAVTSLFAPCAEQEFLRILRPGGYLILVGAGERHLFGLKQTLYEHPYLNPGREDLPEHMRLLRKTRLRDCITVRGNRMIEALFSMTPYYWRTSRAGRERLAELGLLETEIDFDIFLYRKGL